MALSGWIKLHRALADHPIAGDPQAFSVWVHLLLMANHKETKRMMNGQIVVIAPGQLITSRRSISEKTGVQESKVERILKLLKTEQQIEQVGTAKFRVISIVNWDLYQSDEQVGEQQMNSRRTADEQQMNTPGECKELQNGKNQNQKTRSTPSAEHVDFDQFWKLYPRKVGKQAALKAWNKLKPDMILFAEIERALEIGKRSPDWLKSAGQYIPHPSVWLNGRRWEDEADPTSALPFEEIAEAYNEICGAVFSRCEAMTPQRMQLVRSVAAQEVAGKRRFLEGGLDYWRRFFAAAAQSKSWAGQNARGFIADFDFVLRNATTVFEAKP